MAHNKYFQFKQFRIEQHHSAMKVNTDGVLLGAWVNIENATTILDIGTGTGLIALMLAQRCNAAITGIEIDEFAAAEAALNAAKSPWADRLKMQCVSLQHFVQVRNDKYNLIVSNPPFFTESMKNTSLRLSMARHNDSLPFTDIISSARKLLDPEGRLALILPVDEALSFIQLARESGLMLNRLSKVRPFPDKEPNRMLMEFSCIGNNISEAIFSVYDSTGTSYSEEFSRLARDFYLKL